MNGNDILQGIYAGFGIALIICAVALSIRALSNEYKFERRHTRLIWIVSSIIIAISPFVVPVKINNYSEFRLLKFGIIYPFVEQYTSLNITINKFPILATLINPWGHSLKSNLNINLFSYLVSCVITYIILYMCVYLFKQVYKKIKRKA